MNGQTKRATEDVGKEERKKRMATTAKLWRLSIKGWFSLMQRREENKEENKKDGGFGSRDKPCLEC